MFKTLLIFTILLQNAFAIYGEDNRKDYYEISNPKIKELSHAIAYQIERHRELRGITFLKYWKIITEPFANKNICSDEKFIKQPAMRNNCTGILVSEKHLLTAGNCITEHYCKNDLYYWMFGYKIEEKDKFSNKRRSRNFYKCKKVVKRVFDREQGISYALIELNKKVVGIKPVEMSDGQNLSVQDELIVMGHIKGLPLKIADDTQVTDIDHKNFILNSDIAGESRGSAIFNATTYELEGILIYGSNNYISEPNRCMSLSRLAHDDGRELAVKVFGIKDFLNDLRFGNFLK